jgi:hypothetical protein
MAILVFLLSLMSFWMLVIGEYIVGRPENRKRPVPIGPAA